MQALKNTENKVIINAHKNKNQINIKHTKKNQIISKLHRKMIMSQSEMHWHAYRAGGGQTWDSRTRAGESNAADSRRHQDSTTTMTMTNSPHFHHHCCHCHFRRHWPTQCDRRNTIRCRAGAWASERTGRRRRWSPQHRNRRRERVQRDDPCSCESVDETVNTQEMGEKAKNYIGHKNIDHKLMMNMFHATQCQNESDKRWHFKYHLRLTAEQAYA